MSGSDGKPAYKVDVNGTETLLSVEEVSKKYLSTLIGFASDFLGRKIDAAVLAVPSTFTSEQTDALSKACKDAAGLEVLQFLHEPAAAAVAYGLTLPVEEDEKTVTSVTSDRNAVVVDVGASSTTISVVSARQGLYVPLATVHDPKLGGDNFDEQLITFFSKEFTKKTKVTIDASNHRAMMKLRLACEVTKRTLSASTTATCSIESLAEGMDFSGSINRSRFDLLAAKVYAGITARITEALQKAGLEAEQIEEVVFVGGSCKNPTLTEKVAALFSESVILSSQIEPDQVIAKGCVLQALALSKASAEEKQAITASSSLAKVQPQILTSPIGILVPAPAQNGDAAGQPGIIDGKVFVTILDANTPLPARRIVELPAAKGAEAVTVILSEGKQEVDVKKAEQAAPNGKSGDDEDDEDEDDEPEDIRTLFVKPTTRLGQITAKLQKADKPRVRLTVIVTKDGKLEAELKQADVEGAEAQTLHL